MYENQIFELTKKIQVKEKDYEDAILTLVNQFKPLIRKYSYLLNYEDGQSELTLIFIETIYKVPIDNPKFKQDKFIISYINKSVRNNYINLSKNRNKLYYYESPINLDIIESSYETKVEDKILAQELLSLLTKREKEIIKLRYFEEYSNVEISEMFGISRQAVNKTKNRAITKMKRYIFAC